MEAIKTYHDYFKSQEAKAVAEERYEDAARYRDIAKEEEGIVRPFCKQRSPCAFGSEEALFLHMRHVQFMLEQLGRRYSK